MEPFSVVDVILLADPISVLTAMAKGVLRKLDSC